MAKKKKTSKVQQQHQTPSNGGFSPKQYESAIAELNLSQVGAARFLGIDGRTSRKWIAGDARVPPAVSKLLRLMIRLKLEPDTVQ